jgi:hypothetical protein
MTLAFFPAEEAQKSVKGLEENAIQSKYIELVIFMTRFDLEQVAKIANPSSLQN